MKLITTLLLVPQIVFATDIIVNIKGLVCPSCAIGVKKKLIKTNKVKKVTLNIKNETAIIYLIENKNLSDKEIRDAVLESGYEVGPKGIRRK
tara:strand:- start:9 stop:284 length:276 start_codon:yes stop_codon:yes gene_type:complete